MGMPSTWSLSGSKRSMISSLYSCERKENESEILSITNLFCIQAGFDTEGGHQHSTYPIHHAHVQLQLHCDM